MSLDALNPALGERRSRVRIALDMAPFAAAACLAWAVVIVGGNSIDWTDYGIGTGMLLLTGALPFLGARGLRVGGLPSSFVFLAAVGLLRSAAGGVSSGAGGLAVIPVFYTALYGNRRELVAVILATAAFYIVPIIVIGGPAFPHSQYRAALVSLAVSSIVGVATQRLVASVKRQARESRRRELMLEQVSGAIQRLYSSTSAREDVCAAARSVGDASIAILFEPAYDASVLRVTAMAGIEFPPADVSVDVGSPVGEAFAARRGILVDQQIERRVTNVELWRAAGGPRSVLYEPLLRGGEPVGVLVVGWPQPSDAMGGRVTVVELLAHEAAAVLDRADRMSELADRAETDPLTGLPNRRAWDACLGQAIGEGRSITVAMFDLDHFKEFNDTYGHPAGDRLLKETAALWREQLRSGDVLARLGGEEFGLLLLDCDPSQTTEVIERLRERIPEQRTCSAGFAVRASEEPVEQVLARADAALYQAKASGRDRSCMARPRVQTAR
jgi:diguanylate cyclase (GGDEF)-like protein